MQKKKSLLLPIAALIVVALFTCAFILFGLPERAARAEDEAGTTVATVDGVEYTDFSEAWTAATGVATAEVKLCSNVTTTGTLTVGADNNITLDLNGYVLTKSGVDRVITVNGEFTLKDGRPETEHKYKVEDNLWKIDATGDKTLLGGAITGGNVLSRGGGVLIEGTDARFTMESGTVCGNNTGNYGGGVCVSAGSTFEMKGGKIGGNTSSQYGGGVNVNGTFEMTGGTICENKAQRGGGVLIIGTDAKFTMKDGTVTGNYGDVGGGVCIDKGTFEMTGGTVTENTSDYGGGVNVYGGEFKISGLPIVTGNTKKDGSANNVRVSSNRIITVTDELTEGAKIGVETTGEVITGFMQNGNPADFFIPDSRSDCMYFSNENEGKVTIGGEHTEVSDPEVEPTCFESGLTEGSHCSACNRVLEEQEVIPAAGHDYGDWTTLQTPTCEDKGIEIRTCSRSSDHTETRSVAKLNHSYGDWTTLKAPTCEDKGIEIRTCSGNSDHTETRSVAKLNHSYGDWTTLKAPTCEDKGIEIRTCSRNSDHTETRSVAANGHGYATEFTVDTPATCTNDGSKSKHCADCDSTTERTVIPATGHDFGEWTTTEEATADEEGEERRVCANDAAHTETRAIPKLTAPETPGTDPDDNPGTETPGTTPENPDNSGTETPGTTPENPDNSGNTDTPAPDSSGSGDGDNSGSGDNPTCVAPEGTDTLTPPAKSLSGGAIAGIVLGAIAFAVIVAVVAVVVDRKRRLR